MSGKAVDMTGQVFGYLEVMRRAVRSGPGRSALWVCKCRICGRLTVVSRSDLLSGKIKSCGCLPRMTKAQKQALPGAAVPERRESGGLWAVALLGLRQRPGRLLLVPVL